jgi:hypothetical protein
VSIELIAIVVTFLIGVTELTFVAWMVYQMSEKMAADNAAIFLQGRRIDDVLKEMRESLRSAP